MSEFYVETTVVENLARFLSRLLIFDLKPR